MRRKWQLVMTALITAVIITCIYFRITAVDVEKKKFIYKLNQDISKGDNIDPKMLDKVSIPAGVLTNAVDSFEMTKGKVAARDLKKEDMLSVNDLITEDDFARIPEITPGKKLYSILVEPEEVNGSWLIENGRIDLYIQIPYYETIADAGSKSADIIDDSFRIIENVKIARIMDENGEALSRASGTARILSLELDPDEIKIIAFAIKNGSITAAISNE